MVGDSILFYQEYSRRLEENLLYKYVCVVV